MNLGLLLIPALGGYYLLSRTLLWRYWVARQAGYKLFFSAAIAGVVLLVLARLIAVIWPSDLGAPILAWWRHYAPFDYAGTVAISAALAVIIPLVANLFLDKNKCAMQAANAQGDLIECLMQEALDSGYLVEISTKSSKSYIGFVQHSSVTASEESDIAITPIASGYRDGKTRDLVITTNYLPMLLDRSPDTQDFREHFRVVIPLAEIASARRFDPDTYELFRQTKTASKNQPDAESAT